jgi:hypothetical protein
MSTLHATLESLAKKFAADIVKALRSLSLDDLLAESRSAAPRASANAKSAGVKRTRASGSATTVDAIVSELKKHKAGLRAEHLRKALGASKPAFNYYAAKAISEKKIRKTGKKRATTYFAK